jgi:two-component system LytT family sensor kinase
MTLTLQLTGKTVLLRHLMAWCIFVTYEIGSVYFAAGIIGHFVPYLLFYSLNIGMFYFNAHSILPWAFGKCSRPYLLSFLLVSLELVLYLAVKYALDCLLQKFPVIKHEDLVFERYAIVNLWRGLFFIEISILYWSALRVINYQRQAAENERRYFYTLAEKARLEQTMVETQNAYLRQQINPHFLFNTLNFIYNSFYKLSSAAAICVSKLADILRYSIEEVDPDGKVDLSAEIEQLQNLIEINRLRYQFPLYIQLEIKGSMEDKRILPLVLLSFTENMFKHGNLKEAQFPATLSIDIDSNNRLIFVTRNLKKSWTPAQQSQHIGLSNTVKRLKNTYQENYLLSIADKEDTFGIELRINL